MKANFFILGLLPVTLSANFSINVDAGYAKTSSGADVSSLGLGILVVDTNRDGFSQGASLQGKILDLSTVFGADDKILGILTTSDTIGMGKGMNFAGAIADIEYINGIDAGDPVAIYFFPNITNSSTILDGTSYGFFSGVGDGSGIPLFSTMNWKVPADGLYDLTAYTPALAADYESAHDPLVDPSVLNLTATLTVPVPEPSTYALMGLGLVVVGLLARRKNS